MPSSRQVEPSDPPALHRGEYATGGRRPEVTGTLTVVSWNIQFGVDAVAAAEALLVVPDLLSVDIVLLQEMDESGTELIARTIGANFAFASLRPHRQTGRAFGNAVLSRWPLSDPDVAELSHKSAVQGHERLVVGASVAVGAMSVTACSVHTEVPTLSPPKRRRQFDEIAAATKRWGPGPLTVGGDFNTITGKGVAAVDRAMSAVGATRASAGAATTLRRGGREFPLDHVYTRGLVHLDCGVVDGLSASDHRPLWVRLGH